MSSLVCASFLGLSPHRSEENVNSNLLNGTDQKVAMECICLASGMLSEVGAGLLSQLSPCLVSLCAL